MFLDSVGQSWIVFDGSTDRVDGSRHYTTCYLPLPVQIVATILEYSASRIYSIQFTVLLVILS